ncbi:Uncharacterized conserved protein YkwD, contains CAP (CSP/antigen 5/PR1) domain [Granulicella pectinivorans]|uniref:Uncharacterized conserved protein YkwD, contains CAP (CSP/antigen 5/PR1) domain n=1 Tax=Granulicella pectinivorans TaxID=474950 RepID=A0A1I6MS12_9BACT|nr:CAP domain-containing protein [Granulicella pectinivorans]SFS18407.1 Uncharacterized conserved protein YkwD, contains CAP (CSP/antigen 5/PR1) domain [Granulicella pectinivorans]
MKFRSRQLVLALLAVATIARAQSNVAEQYLVAAANQERAAEGIAPLAVDPALSAAALDHVRLMTQRQDISHQFPGELGLFPRIQTYSQAFDAVAENVAYAPTVERLHTGWMNSPGHRANLLNPNYNVIGVAVLINGREIYAVQDFGHRSGPTPPQSIESQAAEPGTDPQLESQPSRNQSVAAAAIAPEALLLFKAANRERAQQHAPQLRWDPSLEQAAAFHAAQMAQRGTISHQFPGEPDLSTRGASAGVHFSLISENVAEAPTAQRVHAAWMQSAGHRTNILDPNVDAIGIAVVVRNGQRFAVQDFARTTQNLTLEQQEANVGALLDNAGLSLIPDNRDARATCATSSGFKGQNQPGFIMRYTTASLDVLPDQLAPHLKAGRYHQASIGACAQNGKGPFSTYRIAILLYP